MLINQKIVFNKTKSNQHSIVLKDDTGIYGPYNPGGYGGRNGNPIDDISRYIFELYNKNTYNYYKQIQSDNLDNPNEFYIPNVGNIANGDEVIIGANSHDILSFPGGVYNIKMTAEYGEYYQGVGNQGQDMIFDLIGIDTIFNNYDSIIVNDIVYKITNSVSGVLFLDKKIEEGFTQFKVGISSSTIEILNDIFHDILTKKLGELICNTDCNSNCNSESLQISKLQLYNWALDRAIEKGDFIQAYEYVNYIIDYCK